MIQKLTWYNTTLLGPVTKSVRLLKCNSSVEVAAQWVWGFMLEAKITRVAQRNDCYRALGRS